MGTQIFNDDVVFRGKVVVVGTTDLQGATAVAAALVPRELASDPLDGTPTNRPAGSDHEIASYGHELYICTSAATPTWIKWLDGAGNETVAGSLTVTGSLVANGGGTLGDASTDVFTATGRVAFRTLATDPLDGTPANRPAGTANEVGVYSGELYLCTNGSTPVWVKSVDGAGNKAVAGNLAVGGTLGVTGVTTLTGALVANGDVTLGNAITDAVVCGGQFRLPTVTDAGPMTATNGTEGDLVYNLSNDKVYVCTTTGTPGTWAALH